MRERFEQQMEILHTELIELGALCEQAIGRTYEVLLEGNQRAAEEIIKKDQVVDAKEREIEDLCFRIILQQQPVARDLRQVSAALKMITDMERIGDQAADIADIVKVTSLGVPDASIRLKDMAKATASMVTKCIDAYVKQDLKLAREVIDFDDIVDDLFDEVKDEILQGMRKGITTDVQSLDYLMIAKYYERIGEDVHPGTIIGRDGKEISGDAGEALKKIRSGDAALTTLGGIGEALGGYKGYGYAMVIELLSAALQDGNYGKALNGKDENGNLVPYHLGHFFIAIDTNHFVGEAETRKKAGEIIRSVRNSTKAPGCDRIYTAGEKEWDIWQQRKDSGVPINESVQKEMNEVRDELGLTQYKFPWE